MQPMKTKAEDLHRRAQELRKAGAMAQMTKGPQLVEETGAFMVALAERVDALTPFLDEGGAS